MCLSLFIIASGAALGALLRWWLGLVLNPLWAILPLGTLAANLLGGLAVGLVSESLILRAAIPTAWRLAIITGFLGGLTTFSTFSLEVSTHIQQGKINIAFLEIALHVLGSVLLTLLGISLAHYLLKTP